MGHQVDHLGSFGVDPPIGEDHRSLIDGRLAEHPWATARELGLPEPPGSHCVWVTADGGSRLRWHGEEKAYDGTAWLQWLLDHVLGPAGHDVTGSVHRIAEPEAGLLECSRIDAAAGAVREHRVAIPLLPPDAPSLADASYALTCGAAQEAQELLLDVVAAAPLAASPDLADFLDEIAEHWPDATAVRAAVATRRAGPAAAEGSDDVGQLAALLAAMPDDDVMMWRSLLDHIDDPRLRAALDRGKDV